MNRLTKELESQQSGQKKEIYRRDDEMDGYKIGNKKAAGCSNIQTAQQYYFSLTCTQFVVILKVMTIKVSEWLRLLGASI